MSNKVRKKLIFFHTILVVYQKQGIKKGFAIQELVFFKKDTDFIYIKNKLLLSLILLGLWL